MLTVQQQPTEEQFTKAFQQAEEGEVLFEGVQDGHRVTVTEKNGQPVVDSVAEDTGEARAESFCHAAAMGAVLALGSAGLAFLAASGGGYILGTIFLSSRVAGQLPAALAGGGAVPSLVSQYIC